MEVMIRNGVERKKDHAIIFVRSKGRVSEVKVSLEQLELLDKTGGKVFLVTNEVPILYVYVRGTNKQLTLKKLFYGSEPVTYTNGDKFDLRPENVKRKLVETVLKELGVN